MQTEYKTLSKKVKSLLKHDENYDVEWKRNPNSLKPEVIVAFANSKNGGSVLVGVNQVKDIDGQQKAEIVGCECSDENKLNIKNKALSCIPPITIEVIKENTNGNPFYRVEIPSGINKPYCTEKGIYKIREDGRNKGITPNELLLMFMEVESETFLKRFKKAAAEIEGNISNVSDDIGQALGHLEDILPQVEAIEELSYIPDEILGHVEKIHSEVGDIDYNVNWNEKRILILLKHFNIEDPKITSLKQNFKQSLNRYLEYGHEITTEEFLKNMGQIFSNATKEQLKLWRDEFVTENEL